MKQYTWETEQYADIWRSGVFDSVAGCLKEAKEDFGLALGTAIYVGEVTPFVPRIYATDVLDRLEDNASDECGEIGEEYEAYDRKEDTAILNELSQKLTKVLTNWLRKYGKYPNFYTVSNVKKYEIK